MISRICWAALYCFVALMGCSDDNSTNAGEDWVLERVSGNEQVVARKDTSAPLVVLLTDRQGTPSSQRIDFEIVKGAGELSQTLVVTDDMGRASVQFIADREEALIQVTASAFGTVHSVTFELSVSGFSANCRAIADEKWDPFNYLAWRGSTISRNSSITHALPCSSYVDVYLETGNFKGCDAAEIQQYYELIGKYDQFAAGWTDLVRVETGNPVQPTEVDSVENFLSEQRLNYEDVCK